MQILTPQIEMFTILIITVSQFSDYAMGWTTGVRFPAGAGISFSSAPRPDRLWGPRSFLSSE
jgi:hypothetical protein